MSSKLSGRRKFLRDSAALVGLAAGVVPVADAQMSHTAATAAPAKEAPKENKECKDNKDLIAYGERSRYVKSIRIPVMERMSPDEFGMTFHVLSPLQDSVGMITATSLHYVATHRGSYVPDINPAGTSADDSRHGGPAADFYGGRTKAPAFCDAHPFSRMQRKSRESHA